jgi:DNA-binding MarR family transcriptional regulator
MVLFRMAASTRCTVQVVTRVLEGGYGITRREWGVVMALGDGQQSPSELAKRLVLDRVLVSRAITGLLNKRLVVRQRAANTLQGRTLLSLSPEGLLLHAELFPRLAAVNVELLEALQPDEVKQLDGLLSKLEVRSAELAARPIPERAQRRNGGTCHRAAGHSA